MFKNFLNHRCDIFHGEQVTTTSNYGLQTGISYQYGEEPDIKAQRCHFSIKGTGSIINSQGEPFSSFQGKRKLGLAIGTDIRLNDKVKSYETGFEYIAELPRNVQNHHIMVYVHRDYSTGGFI